MTARKSAVYVVNKGRNKYSDWDALRRLREGRNDHRCSEVKEGLNGDMRSSPDIGKENKCRRKGEGRSICVLS